MNALILSALISPWRRRGPQSFLDNSHLPLAAPVSKENRVFVFITSSRVKAAYAGLRSLTA